MGGCVVSVMSLVNSSQQVENPEYAKARALGPNSVAIGDNGGRAETPIYRAPTMADVPYDELYKQFYGGKHGTLMPAIKESCMKFSKKNAIAYRPIKSMEKGEIEDPDGTKRPWEFIHLQPTHYLTFEETWTMMVAFGNGLKAIGLRPGTHIALYEDTRYEWLVSLYGLWTQGMVGVTVYANLGEDALAYALKEAEVPVMILNGKMVAKTIRLCKASGIPCPKFITTDDVPVADNVSGAEVYKFTDLVAKGTNVPEPPLPTNPDDIALIMYTSGTTGDPKGVVIAHGNVYATISGFRTRLQMFMAGGSEDSSDNAYVAYLPLAHILEFSAENVMLLTGSMIGFGNPRTLTDTSAKPHGDLKEFRPTFFAGVPRVYDTIKKAVEAKLPPPGDLKRRVFDRAYEERKEAIYKGMDTPYWNEKVFANPRALLGGRCRALVSGGAPLSGTTWEFLSIVFGCSVNQGYALTETCASATIQRFHDPQRENVGGLVDNTELKLRDVEHWTHNDPEPRGEILIRGPAVSKGYYKQPEKTKEAFLADGFFCSGDIGQICKDGTLKIVGRVKALAKNALGEYISIEQLETLYVLNELVLPNGVCVLVDPHKAYIAALVLTDDKKALAFAQKHSISGGYPEVLQSQEFQKQAALSLAATAKGEGRKPFECVKHVRVLSDEWTPENGVLTAAMKLKRRIIDHQYASVIQELFSE